MNSVSTSHEFKILFLLQILYLRSHLSLVTALYFWTAFAYSLKKFFLPGPGLLALCVFAAPSVLQGADDEIKWWCYRHKVAGHLRLRCYEPITRPGEPIVIQCYDKRLNKYTAFTPTSSWERIDSSKPICRAPSIGLPDIPRGE